MLGLVKRMQLFEFEDLAWFPNGLRKCLTAYLQMLHRMLGTRDELVKLLAPLVRTLPEPHILDLCSGSGGPMPDVAATLRELDGLKELRVTLTDKFPNHITAAHFNDETTGRVRYRTQTLDAANIGPELRGLRTLICSLHHMPPVVARGILENAQRARQPFCCFEISDNSFPKALWWLAIPFNVLSVFLLTPLVRPLTWQQLLFTYVIPVLPFLIAWDGAVSNARTYTQADLEELLAPLRTGGYQWHTGTLAGRGGKRLYLVGQPA